MRVTSFACDSCAGSIPLSDLSNITVCPYCKKNFYVNEEWEESLRIATKKAEAVLVRNMKDIQIPEVQEKISIRDIEILKRINESIIFLNRAASEVSAKLRANNEVIAQIENTVGLKYEELTVKTPDPNVVNFALQRMKAAPIEFEVACANFSSNEYKDPIEYPLEKHNHDDVKIQIQKAIEHIKM